MKKVVLALALILSLVSVKPALATEQTCTQTTQYGGAVTYICGAKTHEPIETGLVENLALVGGLSLGVSAFLHKLAKRTKEIANIN